MALKEFRCTKCGYVPMQLLEDGIYKCPACRAQFKEDSLEKVRDELKDMFGELSAEQKEEQVANIRANLWAAVNEEYTDSEKIKGYCQDLKKLLPDDFQANFYEAANSGNARHVNHFLSKIDLDKFGAYVDDVVEFMIKSLDSKVVLPLKRLIERAFTGEKFTDYMTRVETEAEKLKNGIYSSDIPRDVFIAYSSADMERVNEIVEFLEGQKINCYVALRNLRHGRGAVENYEKELEKAMHRCKCVVFFSSNHSRDLDCDALKIELPYIRDEESHLGRIEYILDDYSDSTPLAAKKILEDFFAGLEYCRDKEDLLTRVLNYTTGKKGRRTASTKFCKKCGTENPIHVKFCGECGNGEFVTSIQEYVDVQKNLAQEEVAANEQQKAQAEIERIKAEYEEKLRELEREKDVAKEQADKANVPQENQENENRLPKEVGGFKAAMKEQIATVKEGAGKLAAGIKGTAGKIATVVKEKAGQAVKAIAGDTAKKEEPKPPVPPAPPIDDYPTLDNYDKRDFEIIDSTLTKYKGKASVVKIPKGVTAIGEYAFADRKRTITSVTIPKGVTVIGQYAFHDCERLNRVTIPDGVTSIGALAFNGCWKLNDIQLPDSVTFIDNYAFGNTAFYKNPSHWKDGLLYIGKFLISANESLQGSCQVAAGTQIIAPNAFRDCVHLTNVELPKGLKEIQYCAFEGCKSLQSVTVPSGVAEIGWGVFRDCKSLQNVTIPSGVTTIGFSTFEGCKSLRSVVIPAAVKQIGIGAFKGCKKLKCVYYRGTKEKWKKIDKYAWKSPMKAVKIVYLYSGS